MRAKTFFEVFCENIKNIDFNNLPSEKLVSKFDKLFSNEDYQEIFYENYRRALFSASKKIGPRILAIITAKLINEEREATEYEERFCLLAEIMNDKYFRSFKKDFEEKFLAAASDDANKTNKLFLHTELVSSLTTGLNSSKKPIYMMTLINFGIVEESIISTQIPSRGGAGPQMNHNMTSHHYTIDEGYKHLIDLIDFSTFY
jgi:hypothetical protein